MHPLPKLEQNSRMRSVTAIGTSRCTCAHASVGTDAMEMAAGVPSTNSLDHADACSRRRSPESAEPTVSVEKEPTAESSR